MNDQLQLPSASGTVRLETRWLRMDLAQLNGIWHKLVQLGPVDERERLRAHMEQDFVLVRGGRFWRHSK